MGTSLGVAIGVMVGIITLIVIFGLLFVMFVGDFFEGFSQDINELSNPENSKTLTYYLLENDKVIIP